MSQLWNSIWIFSLDSASWDALTPWDLNIETLPIIRDPKDSPSSIINEMRVFRGAKENKGKNTKNIGSSHSTTAVFSHSTDRAAPADCVARAKF